MPGSQIQFASHATPRAPGRLPGTVIRPYVRVPVGEEDHGRDEGERAEEQADAILQGGG